VAHLYKHGNPVGQQYDGIYNKQPVHIGLAVSFNGAPDQQEKESYNDDGREYHFPFVMKSKINMLVFALVALEENECSNRHQDEEHTENNFCYELAYFHREAK
jgi:hypothetical protein